LRRSPSPRVRARRGFRASTRGLFKTSDGGRTWNKVLYISDHVGVIDLVRDRSAPDVLYAATNYQLYGDRYVRTPNEPDALAIVYYVRDGGASATVTVTGAGGSVVTTLQGPAKPGINRVYWNMQDAKHQPVAAGEFTITVSVADRSEEKVGRVRERVSKH
jgi:hypothetical protein